MSIKHRTGQGLGLLGSIIMLSALLYWISGMFLTGGTIAIHNALMYGLLALILYVFGGVLIEGDAA